MGLGNDLGTILFVAVSFFFPYLHILVESAEHRRRFEVQRPGRSLVDWFSSRRGNPRPSLARLLSHHDERTLSKPCLTLRTQAKRSGFLRCSQAVLVAIPSRFDNHASSWLPSSSGSSSKVSEFFSLVSQFRPSAGTGYEGHSTDPRSYPR
jgi:hypothetical protein